MPNFSTIFFFFTLANMSLPGTSSFIGEFLILVGAFQRNSLVATLATLGMIFGATYSHWHSSLPPLKNPKMIYITRSQECTVITRRNAQGNKASYDKVQKK
ncbi:hypothetical protein R6Q59_020958 [Mikania micrantha]